MPTQTNTRSTTTSANITAADPATAGAQTNATADQNGLRINLLGGFQLTMDGDPIKAFSNTRLQRLLGYLILHSGTPQTRQGLAALFWPDSSDSQARTNLRNALHLLRTHLPNVKACLHSDNKQVT